MAKRKTAEVRSTRYSEWMGTIDFTWGSPNGRGERPIVRAVFKKMELRWKDSNVSEQTIETLNMGLISRPGPFYSLWLPQDDVVSWEPVELDIEKYS